MVMPTCETAARQTAIELRPLKAESAGDSAISMGKLELVFDSTIGVERGNSDDPD